MSRPPIHPGEILADELKEIGVTATELARQIDVPPNRISEIIRGRRAISGDTALRLGHWFGTAPQFWINLQMSHDLRRAAEQSGRAIEKLPTRSDTPSPPMEPRPAFP
jgi:addiction module HigA family antidote